MTKQEMVSKLKVEIEYQKSLIAFHQKQQVEYMAKGMIELHDFHRGQELARTEILEGLEILVK